MPRINNIETIEIQPAQVVWRGVGAGSVVLPIDDDAVEDLFISSAAPVFMLASLAITAAAGTPSDGSTYRFTYNADVNFGGNSFTIMGTTMPIQFDNKKCTIITVYDAALASWTTEFIPDFSEDDIITTNLIQNGAVTNAKIDPIGGINGTLIQAGTIPGTALADGIPTKTLERTLDAGTIQNIWTSPVELLPATIGTTYMPVRVILHYWGGTAAFAAATQLDIYSPSNYPTNKFFELDLLAQNSEGWYFMNPFTPVTGTGNTQGFTADRVNITAVGADPTLGDWNVTIRMNYIEVI